MEIRQAEKITAAKRHYDLGLIRRMFRRIVHPRKKNHSLMGLAERMRTVTTEIMSSSVGALAYKSDKLLIIPSNVQTKTVNVCLT